MAKIRAAVGGAQNESEDLQKMYRLSASRGRGRGERKVEEENE